MQNNIVIIREYHFANGAFRFAWKKWRVRPPLTSGGPAEAYNRFSPRDSNSEAGLGRLESPVKLRVAKPLVFATREMP